MLVAPSIRSTFEGKFNEAEVTDGAVEKQYVLVIASCSISFLQRSIEIKISHEDPKAMQVNLSILKPINKNCSGQLTCGPIYCSQRPFVQVLV